MAGLPVSLMGCIVFMFLPIRTERYPFYKKKEEERVAAIQTRPDFPVSLVTVMFVKFE